MKKEYIDNDVAHVWAEEGILNFVYKISRLDMNFAKKSVEVRKNLSFGQSYPMFIDISEIKSTSKEAREYLSKGIAIENISAAALLAGSVLSKLLGTFFLTFNKPPIPLRIFTDRTEAIKWLKKYVEDIGENPQQL